MTENKGSKRIEVKAPMAGVFYRRSAPDQPVYAEVGDKVKKKDILALLETMKVFQKVKSPSDGTVVEIKIENETPVSDNTVLIVLEK